MCGFCDRRSFLAFTTAAFGSAILGQAVTAQPSVEQNVDKPTIRNRSYLQENPQRDHLSRAYKRQTELLAQNVRVVGYSDLEGKPAFKMSIREHQGRWYLFTGHFWHSGWSIVDVTDPAQPRVVKFLAGPENTWTLQMELSGNIMITALEQIFPNFGGDTYQPFDEGVLIWDISDPLNPQQLGQFRTGGTGTHRNFYAGDRYMHLAAGMPGYEGNIYVIVDISNPANPREVGRWWVPGQHQAGGEKPTAAYISHHGPPYIVGNLAYLAYGAAGMVILDISDLSKPQQIGRLPFSPPFHSRFGVHGVLPLPEQGIAYVNSEDVSYGGGAVAHASIVDIRDPANPYLLAVLPRPIPPEGYGYSDFSEKGGWQGPHNINHLQHNPDVEKQGNLLYLTYFNAGLRIFDVSKPRLPQEVGYFIPPDPKQRFGSMPEGRLVVQTEDVLVDRRGYIYISHKNQGVWILKYGGVAKMWIGYLEQLSVRRWKLTNHIFDTPPFIGIDVHKKSYSVVARCDKEVVKKWTTAASPKELSQQLQKYFSGAIIHSVYEAGFSGFALHRELVEHGINNIVVHAASIEVAANDRVKTDKRDAQKMATLHEAGRLKGNRIPSKSEEQRRMLTRTRQQLVEERTAIKNKIRMKFHQLGLIEYNENRSMSHKLVKELLSGVNSSEFVIVIQAYWNIWQKLDEEIGKLAQAIKEQAKTDPKL